MAVKVGVPVVAITIVGAVLLGAAGVSETRARIDETYAFQAKELTDLIAGEYRKHPDDFASMNTFLDNLVDTHPNLLRVRLFSSGFGNPPYVWASSVPSDFATVGQSLLLARGEHLQRETDLDGETVFLHVEPVAFPNGVASVGVYFSNTTRSAVVSKEFNRIARDAVLVVVVEIITLVTAMYLLVLRRVKRLGKAAAAVAGGDLSVRLPEGEGPPGVDELVNVAREFDHMVRAIDERTRELAESADREREAAERLRRLDEVKNTLLHAVSHDLRSPITSVLGSAATLERNDPALSPEDREELLRGLTSSARKMHRLVSDLLDLDRLDMGIIEPKRAATDMAELARGVVEELGFPADRPVDVDAEQVTIAVDAPKAERIVENLLANAVRHTKKGTPIWVKVRPAEAGAEITVEDAGPGVPPELRESVFEPFKQGGPAGTSAGVGIGLSLVARFAELHGGRAWITEREGGGASFHVYLPDGPAEPDEQETRQESEEGAARIATERGGRSSIG